LSSSIHSMLNDKKVQAFTCGLAAGLLAKLGSHPLDIAEKRYQVAGLQRSLPHGARVEERVAARAPPVLPQPTYIPRRAWLGSGRAACPAL